MSALRDDHVIELGELLEFLATFLHAERTVVAPALERFCGGYRECQRLCVTGVF